MEWISIKDKLPEYNRSVWVYLKDEGLCSANRMENRDSEDVWVTEEYCICYPTHWMPSPQIPKIN